MSEAPASDPAVTKVSRPPSKPPDPSRQRWLVHLGHHGRAGAADYFYQIIIVVIGVFLGITFEGMASARERTQKAHSSLIQLLEDLNRDDADMSRIRVAQEGQSRDMSEIATWLVESGEEESMRIDSLLEKVTTSLTVYPRRGMYASMISSGQLALLPQEVSSSIVNLYENVYTRLAANGEHYDYSLERDFFPAFAHAWDPTGRRLIATDETARLRFRNTVSLMRAWSAYYSDLVAQSQVHLRAVVATIEASTAGDR